MKFLLFTLTLILVSYATWSYAVEPVFFDDSPRALKLSNQDGNELEVTLFKRDATHVYFRRTDDPTLYRYPLEQLSPLSRCKVWFFPKVNSTKKPWLSSDSSDDTLAQTHLDAMIQKYDEMSEQLTLVSLKRDGYESNSEQASLSGEIKILQGKINSLAYKIEDFKYRYPQLQHSGRQFKAIIEKKSETDTSSDRPLPFGLNDFIGR